jgi:hypothetical protein
MPLSASSASVRVSSVHPSGVRCFTGVRLSSVRASGVRVRCPCPVSSAPCPTSGIQCPARASGIPVCRVRSVRTGQFVEREGAAGSHTPRDRPGRHVTLPCPRAVRRLPKSNSGAWSWRRPRWQRRRRLDPAAVVEALGGGQARRLADRETPVARRIAPRQGSRCAEVDALGRPSTVGRSALPACGPPRPESLGRRSSVSGGPFGRSASVRGPTAPKAAGRPSEAVRPGGETRSGLSEQRWACQDLSLRPTLKRESPGCYAAAGSRTTR